MSQAFREWMEDTASLAQLVVMVGGLLLTVATGALLLFFIVIGTLGLLSGAGG